MISVLRNLLISYLSKWHTCIVKNKTNIIGRNSILYYRSKIYNKGGIVEIGSNTTIGGGVPSHVGMPFYTTIFIDNSMAKVKIGDNCRINGAYIHSKKYIYIGNNCVISNNVNIVDSNGHETISDDRTKNRDSAENIIIGNNVWIGVNAVILKGTEIGDNSVIAAGSIVKGKYPKNSMISNGIAIVVKKLQI